jgi:phage I-like protein
MGKKIASKRRHMKRGRTPVRTSPAAKAKPAPKPIPIQAAEWKPTTERIHTAPLQIRLTENSAGEMQIPTRIQLFRTGAYTQADKAGKEHKFKITREHLEAMVKNWSENVRGIDLALDFGHKSDEEAAAWFKDLLIEDAQGFSELWAEVEWTPDGKAAIAAKKYRYISPDFAFVYKDNESGKTFGPTLFGAGLTNRPIIKNMAPAIELTEVEDMTKEEIAALEAKAAKVDALEAEKKALELKLAEAEQYEEEGDGGEKSFADMTDEEKSAAYEKVCSELAEMKKAMVAKMAEAKTAKQSAAFDKLLTEGKVCEAQRAPFISGDTVKFAELQVPIKLDTQGTEGGRVETKTSAQDEVLQLAEKAVKDGKFKGTSQAIGFVLKENPKLNERYQKEMEGAA